MNWWKLSSLLLLFLAVTSHGFRFQADDESPVETEKLSDESENPVEYEELIEEPEKEREERKIDPLVVDVERKPIEAKEDTVEETAAEEQAEGRFFLKDKLCALGLADCNEEKTFHSGGKRHTGQGIHHGSIQYVQPVKVVPHGSPIPAIPVNSAPRPSYNVPKPSYNAPSSSYGAPSYTAPSDSYGAPATDSYGAPASDSYGAPKPSYNAPTSSYGAPKPSYNAPKPSYNPPKPSYNPPKPSYNAPSSSYGAPRPSYSAPSSSYGSSFNRFDGNIDYTDDGSAGDVFQTSFDYVDREGTGGHHGHGHGHGHHGHHAHGQHGHHEQGNHGHHANHDSGHRTGRADECYCVPAAQCPTQSVMTSFGTPSTQSNNGPIGNVGFQDYSALVNPRTLPSGIDSILEHEEADTLDLTVETPLPEDTRARSLKTTIQAVETGEDEKKHVAAGEGNDDTIELTEELLGEVEKARRRRRRDAPVEVPEEEAQFPDVQSRQHHHFGPNGFKPPTCGGPASGYVCCRVGVAHNGFTQFIESPSNQHFSNPSSHANHVGNLLSGGARPSREQDVPQQQFTNFGQCGKKNAKGLTGRIASTDFREGDTDFAEYPWQVAILKKEEFDNVYVCGGSLIDGSHILTAAHCIKDYKPQDLRLRLGEWDVNNDSEFYTHIEFDATDIFIHEEYYPGNLYNDIAMVRLKGYVDFTRNPHVSPVCLPDHLEDFAGQRCHVSGWGKDAFETGSYQNVLKEVEVPIHNHRQCENMLRSTRLGPGFVLHQGFICAGGEHGKDACKGDGGGPLVCEVNGISQLAGIVSWGVGCGQHNVPGVYVKVSHYQQWIQDQLLRRN